MNCSEPADFFEHSKCSDGGEACLPYCKHHAQDMAQIAGQAVLFAVDFGVVHDLPFWDNDTLPDGSVRCDRRYRASDHYGLTWARCTRTATKRVRTSEEGESHEANVCPTCLAHPGRSEQIEVLADVAMSTPLAAETNLDAAAIPTAEGNVAHSGGCPYKPSVLRKCESPMILDGCFVECGKPAWHIVERLHGDLDGWYCCECYAKDLEG